MHPLRAKDHLTKPQHQALDLSFELLVRVVQETPETLQTIYISGASQRQKFLLLKTAKHFRNKSQRPLGWN